MQYFLKNKFILFGLLWLMLTSYAVAKNLTPMQQIQHATPMPALIMHIAASAEILELSSEQLEPLINWRRDNQTHILSLAKNIIEVEAKIKQEALASNDKVKIDDLKDTLLQMRGELIDLRHKCIAKVQTVLNEQQWAQLMEIRERQQRIASSDIRAVNEIQGLLRVSPLPKLMAIVLMHGKDLNLTPEQSTNLESWRLRHMNTWAFMFDDVLTTERRITQLSLEGIHSDEKLMGLFNDMSKKRQKMAQMTLNCINNMKETLSTEQWDQVVKLVKSYI